MNADLLRSERFSTSRAIRGKQIRWTRRAETVEYLSSITGFSPLAKTWARRMPIPRINSSAAHAPAGGDGSVEDGRAAISRRAFHLGGELEYERTQDIECAGQVSLEQIAGVPEIRRRAERSGETFELATTRATGDPERLICRLAATSRMR